MSEQQTFPYFPYFPRDMDASAKVAAMSTLGFGAYMLILNKAWYQFPVGSVPNDDAVLQMWARVSKSEWKKIATSVKAAFELKDDGRLHQRRMQQVYENVVKEAENKSKKASNAAHARWGNRQNGVPEESTGNAQASSEHMHGQSLEPAADMLGDAITNTNTNNTITHTPRGDALTFLSACSPGFRLAFDAYPVKREPAEGWKVWQAVISHFVTEVGKNESDTEAWIAAKAKRYAKSPAGKAPPVGQVDDYRPSFAKWLEKGRYEEPDTEWQKPNVRGDLANQESGKRGGKKPAAAKARGSEAEDSIDKLFDQFDSDSARRVAEKPAVGLPKVAGVAGES